MGIEYSFELRCKERVSETFIHQILYVLVSRGSVFNGGEYPGRYLIQAGENERRSNVDGSAKSAGNECVERLPEIVSEYGEYDLSSATLTIHLVAMEDSQIHYSLAVIPGVDHGTLCKLQSHSRETQSPAEFDRFVGHVEELCRRFDVEYAGYRTEYETIGAYPWNDGITPESLRAVTYYSSEYVEAFGRERLLSLPASEVREHEDGGVFIVVTPDPSNEYDAVQRAREYLAD